MITKEEMIALRKARAEIEARYDLAKEKALAQLYDKMCEDHREYSSSELADITGLSKPSVTKRLRNSWNFESKFSPIHKKYVELDKDGTPMMDKVHTRTYRSKVYKVRADSSIMDEYNKKHPKKKGYASTLREAPVEKEKTNPSIGGAMVRAMIEKYSGACEE